jgi:large subunit ribosomal protein L4
MPKKMRRAALRSALSQKAAQKEIVLVDQIKVAQTKTKEMAETIHKLTGGTSALIVLDKSNENVERSVRNLPKVKTLRANYLNIRDILGFKQLILPVDALEIIESYLGVTGEAA